MKNQNSSVKKFFKNFLIKHRKEFSVIMALATFGSLLTAITPYIYGKLFDLALIENSTISLLLSLIFLWATLGLISNFTSAKTSELGRNLGGKMSLESEIDSYGHFLTLPISFHKNKKTGSILQKISRGSWHLDYFISIASGVLPSLIIFFFSIITMLIINWILGLCVLFAFTIYLFITLKYTKPSLKAEEKLNESFEKQYGNVYDRLYNVFLIKNFATEKEEKKKIEKAFINKAFPSYKSMSKVSAKLQYIQGIVHHLSFVIILSLAILSLRNGNLTEGEFIMFFGYINLAFNPLFQLSEFYNYYKRSSVGIKRMIKLKQLVPEEMKHGNKIIDDFKGEIKFENISFNYEKNKDILKNIDLEIKAGESIALVGESGVGKSTLSELVFGYYKPTRGTIFLDGTKNSKLKLSWIRKQIAIVPQQINTFNDTLINNLKYANPKAKLDDIIKATKAANAHDFIIELPKKYNTQIGEKGVKLSAGQKQRLAIAMAFLKNPKILILDEPTSTLDAKSEKKVQEGIKKLISERTTIIIAHRFSTIKDVDKIVVLDKGEIIEVGNHKELIKKNGKYAELYKLQRGLD